MARGQQVSSGQQSVPWSLGSPALWLPQINSLQKHTLATVSGSDDACVPERLIPQAFSLKIPLNPALRAPPPPPTLPAPAREYSRGTGHLSLIVRNTWVFPWPVVSLPFSFQVGRDKVTQRPPTAREFRTANQSASSEPCG